MANYIKHVFSYDTDIRQATFACYLPLYLPFEKYKKIISDNNQKYNHDLGIFMKGYYKEFSNKVYFEREYRSYISHHGF